MYLSENVYDAYVHLIKHIEAPKEQRRSPNAVVLSLMERIAYEYNREFDIASEDEADTDDDRSEEFTEEDANIDNILQDEIKTETFTTMEPIREYDQEYD